MPPPGAPPDDALLAAIAEGLPAGINLELDGRWVAMLSYKMKTYALLDGEGRVTLRGSAFRSRGIEPFQRRLIQEIVSLLLAGRGADVKAVIDRWLGDFAGHRVPVRDFARTETLHENLEVYRDRVSAGQRPVSAPYELAATAGRPWQPGDQISYYVTGRGAHVPVSERTKLAAAWDAAHPDENLEYYQAKVQEIWDRFRPFVDHDGLWPCIDEPEPSPQLSLF